MVKIALLVHIIVFPAQTLLALLALLIESILQHVHVPMDSMMTAQMQMLLA